LVKFWKFEDYEAVLGCKSNSKVVKKFLKFFLKFRAIFPEFSQKCVRKTEKPLNKGWIFFLEMGILEGHQIICCV
jgi:hypothetical protein